MDTDLSAAQEHYLKRELLRLELSDEFEKLNDPHALRKFGYPFTTNDPKLKSHTSKVRQILQSPTKSKKCDTVEQDDSSDIVSEFPLLSHFLREFVMSFPLLSKDLAKDETFWQGKVQIFFEHFMGLNFSSSFDRDELTKRKKLSLKLSKIILLLYNSGIGCSKEIEYYEHDKFILSDGGLPQESKKKTKLDQFVMPTRENLQNLVTKEPMYINGWDVNIISVTDEATLFSLAPVQKPEKSTTSKWMKSTFGITSPFSSPSNFLSKLSLAGNPTTKSKHIFIIRTRQEFSDGATAFAARTYEDFKNLAHNLKKEFPGKNLPKLPHRNKLGTSIVTSNTSNSDSAGLPCTPKEKIISSFSSTSSTPTTSLAETDGRSTGSQANVMSANEKGSEMQEEEEEEEENEDYYEEFADANDTKSSNLPREKMRTSLRQYLRTLCQEKEVAFSMSLKKFFIKSVISLEDFPGKVQQDIKNRELMDVTNLENQIGFQKLAFERSLELQESMKSFKTSVLKDSKFLLALFQEVREKDKVEQLSPTLTSFFEWCKIQLSATIYQLFLGNDDSYEFYMHIRRLHRLMPYSVMVQILKFTNPMAIMKGMMDLFMAQPFGGYSLLQTMFSTVLNDDLKSQLKTIGELENAISKESSFGSQIIVALAKAIFENEHGEFVDMEQIHEDSKLMSMPMTLIIVMKCAELGQVSQDALSEIIESYNFWKKQKEATKLAPTLTSVSSNSSIGDNPALYFSHVKELLQMYIRERDKKLMKQLWQDPELSQLLKSIVTLFYEPMVKIFKISKVDVAFRNFEKFMNDLMKLMDDVITGNLGSSTAFNVVDAINKLVTKHEGSFYGFIHDIYIHDTENIFEGFIEWIVNIVNFLQTSKYGGSSDRLNITNLINNSINSGIDAEALKEQLNLVIDQKLKAREVYQRLVDLKISQEGASGGNDVVNVMDERWKELNHMLMPDSSAGLGIQDGDLVDLDLDVGDYEYLQKEEEEELQDKYREILEQPIEESEIVKFNNLVFKSTLKNILDV